MQIDCSELRSRFFSVCIPPAGLSPPVEQHAELEPFAELPYACSCAKEDGSLCRASFNSVQALAMHMRLTIGGTHGKAQDFVSAAVCNQCPWCRHIFASVWVAQKHIRTRLQRGQCGVAVFAKLTWLCHMNCHVLSANVSTCL